MTLSLWGQWLSAEMIPTGIIRQGDLDKQPVIVIIACFAVGLQNAGHKAVNFDKLQEITQRLDENPAQFLAKLTEVLQKYTKLDPFYVPVVPRYPKETKKRQKKALNSLNETF